MVNLSASGFLQPPSFRALLTLLFAAACCIPVDTWSNSHAGLEQTPSKVRRPNIVLLLFDDVGYSDMSAFGGEIETPHIKRIANEGMTIRRFYTAARCSPTRAGILTGRYPHAVGMADLANGPRFKTEFAAYQGQLPAEIPLVSEILQSAGYQTYMQGKWHLGKVPEDNSESVSDTNPAPNRRGFNHFFGFLGGNANPHPKNSLRHLYIHNRDKMELERDWYSVTGLNDRMLIQLEADFHSAPQSPFFVYIASQAPHLPLSAPTALIEKYRQLYQAPLPDLWNARVANMQRMGLFSADVPLAEPKFPESLTNIIREAAPVRAAMIETADAALGDLVSLLEKYDKLDNTLIIIASDNGASAETARLTNAPLKGSKGDLWEGGTLSFLVARWPAGQVTSDTVSGQMATYLDLAPTMLEVAGVAYPQTWRSDAPLAALEGRSLLPALRGEDLPPPENFFWNLYGRYAVLHKGRWKLLANPVYEEDKERNNAPPTLLLFDLWHDPAETRNLAGKNAEMTSLLLAKYRAWEKQYGAVPYYRVLDQYQEFNRKQRLKAQQLFAEALERKRQAKEADRQDAP